MSEYKTFLQKRIDLAKEEDQEEYFKLTKLYSRKFPELFQNGKHTFSKTGDKECDAILKICAANLSNASPELSNVFVNVARIAIERSVENKINPPKEQSYNLTDEKKSSCKIVRNHERKAKTLSQILTEKIEPPKWIVEQLIPEGVTLVCGPSKSGKSYLMLYIAFCILEGQKVFGEFQVEEAPFLYFDLEESQSELLERIKDVLGKTVLSEEAGFYTIENKPQDLEALLSDLDNWIKENPKTRLIVVDTMVKIQPESKKGLSDYQNDSKFVGNLQAWAKAHKLAIVLVHHTTKTTNLSDPFKEIIGSVGLFGSSDMALVLKMNPDEKTHTLFVRGNRGNIKPIAIEMNWSNGNWNYLGDSGELSEKSEIRQILEILKDYPEGLGPKDISKLLDLPENTVSVRLSRLKTKGSVKNVKRGRWTV